MQYYYHYYCSYYECYNSYCYYNCYYYHYYYYYCCYYYYSIIITTVSTIIITTTTTTTTITTSTTTTTTIATIAELPCALSPTLLSFNLKPSSFNLTNPRSPASPNAWREKQLKPQCPGRRRLQACGGHLGLRPRSFQDALVGFGRRFWSFTLGWWFCILEFAGFGSVSAFGVWVPWFGYPALGAWFEHPGFAI